MMSIIGSNNVQQKENMYSEKITLSGHIFDSLILPKVLDEIVALGGDYTIEAFEIGRTGKDTSRALINVSAPGPDVLKLLLTRIKRQGAMVEEPREAELAKAGRDGILPEGFYATTNLETDVLLGNRWIKVRRPEMDCAIVVSPDKRSARTVPMADVHKGELVVVGEEGVRVVPQVRREKMEEFRFMRSRVSPEKPKGVVIQEIATLMKKVKRAKRKILLVGGPAIVHTGAGPYVEHLINNGYIDVLFAGNALAVHDIEYALFETSLGIYLDRGQSAEGGHGHHVRAINTIRRAGGIRKAVSRGILRSGVMFTCVKKKIPYVLAGSIRDDGPLPDVITDTVRAQNVMRAYLKGVDFVMMISTELHSIAVGNLLPASVKVVCVDINPAVVTKLIDRGSFQAAGIVTDAELFLRELSGMLS
jgi:lysine-ketoglutarate reductase/saccharopine dehydrogenase-like protein (TIGR00300 family)